MDTQPVHISPFLILLRNPKKEDGSLFSTILTKNMTGTIQTAILVTADAIALGTESIKFKY
ncbi:hypothetical protein MKZ02_15005 [Pseudobacillus sp. FSL P4-0506]|uniref:hypothetical protein n=1 Tax=unclassified Pseudobacillus TaxID=2619284 RepID=UPI0030FABDA4